MFKPGSIRKIEVKNFVTYSYTELYPGPNLNMIIGPNGTGKSTMVAAIILGLGGNPKVVGRGTRISEYVKHNCEYASIKIFLQGESENKYIQISREFDTQERSSWKINGNKATLNSVEQCISEYNIQVNNLCQFLPQDRVQDFAKLNKYDLLKETQKALCRTDLIEKQEQLIESRERHKNLLSVREKYEKKLEESREANVRLEGRVKNFQIKKKYNEQVQHIDRKIAWVMYDDSKMKLQEIKNDKLKAAEVYEKYKNTLKPMEDEINEGKQEIQTIQQKNSRIMQVIRNSESSINGNIDKVDIIKNSIRTVQNDMDVKLAEIEEKENEINSSEAKLVEMKRRHSEMLSKFKEGEHNKHIWTKESNRLTTQRMGLQDKLEEITQLKQNQSAQIRAIDNEVTRLENVKQTRLMQLQRIDQDAYNATLWLRNNRHLFKGQIFEPIMLEVNVLDAKNAIYVESVIPHRDRLAFTCVEKSDMNLLISHLREKQNLTVSVLHSGNNPGETLNSFQPRIPIEHLRRYGLYTYLHSLFTAPEPIMRYLCKTYRLHNIPVGNQKTNECYQQVPPQIRQFFSDKYKYSISYSKYSNEKSTKQIELHSDGGLSVSLDVVKLERLQGQKEEILQKCGNYDSDLEKFGAQINQLNESIHILKRKVQELNSHKSQADTVEQMITALGRKIREMKENNKTQDIIKREAEIKIKKLVLTLTGIQESIKNDLKNISDLIPKANLNNVTIESVRKKIAFLENEINDVRQNLREAEATLNRVKEEYATVMTEAKSALNRAKELSNGFTPNDDGFDEFRQIYDKLGCDIKMLKLEKEKIQSKISCLNTADDVEMNEFADREKLIEQLTLDIERSNSELNKITSKMERLQESWLVPLKQLVSDINYKFAAAFERMGCAGEVSISTGVNDKDYAEYGLCIKVTYRNNEPLQELNTTVQSGGERAVATAAFMLSLQELTPVPFRCVDEINQGMDANNERRIFEILVDATSQQNTAQYFLITPKLVPNLKYSRSVMVHIVHNGPFVAKDRKWSFSKMCNPQGIHIS